VKLPTPTRTELPREYHTKSTTKRNRSVDSTLDRKPFIAWDGEGVNLRGPGKPQSYVLFGSSEGCIIDPDGLSTFECLDHIIEIGQANPDAIHVGFAFGYDSNMIVQSLSPTSLARLHRDGWVRLKRSTGDTYVLTYAKSKYFRVTKHFPNYDRKKNPHAKLTVQIFDIFSFFTSSFIKAYEKNVGPVPDIITSGKAGRSSFSIDEMDVIYKYWSLEIQLLKELAEELRRRVYNAGLRINQWYGPGALASFALRQHAIADHMADTSPEIRRAARFAYAGGRFELYKCGRITGKIYSIDINSAYPFGITQLPSLQDGEWHYTEHPTKLARFGVYHVRLFRERGFSRTPSPLFHRDKEHNITFPWTTDGWYWGPEAFQAQRYGAEIVEGYEYLGSTVRPFSWVSDMYSLRRDWKARGISAELALKLCMNSMYGKLAQRIGWDEIKKRIPPFHQLEWAGWVTSNTRAMLFNIISQIPFEHLIAVETDGLYTTLDPATLGIYNSEELGGWEIKEYSEMMYLQSGLAWLKDTSGTWTEKRRGLDGCKANHQPEECDCPSTFNLNTCRTYLKSLHPKPDRYNPWNAHVGQTTRFVGIGQALASSLITQERHCVWETVSREISPGQSGKRVHMHRFCSACQSGLSAYDAPHDLVIHSMSVLEPGSYQHSIPWESEHGHARWRDYSALQNDDVTLQYV
jgi:hypothetical protein